MVEKFGGEHDKVPPPQDHETPEVVRTTEPGAVALAVGDSSWAAADGDGSIAIAMGHACRVRAADNGWIILIQPGEDGHQQIRAARVGPEGPYPGTWYKWDDHARGKFLESSAAEASTETQARISFVMGRGDNK